MRTTQEHGTASTAVPSSFRVSPGIDDKPSMIGDPRTQHNPEQRISPLALHFPESVIHSWDSNASPHCSKYLIEVPDLPDNMQKLYDLAANSFHGCSLLESATARHAMTLVDYKYPQLFLVASNTHRKTRPTMPKFLSQIRIDPSEIWRSLQVWCTAAQVALSHSPRAQIGLRRDFKGKRTRSLHPCRMGATSSRLLATRWSFNFRPP